MKRSDIFYILLVGVFLFQVQPAAAQSIPSPEDFYGFKMGTDGELVHWNKVVEYFHLLASRSDKVIVRDLGESTLGNPFLLAIFSSPDNLRNLEKYRQINKQLADPRGLSESEINNLISEGKYVSAQTYSLHATEVGGINCVSELAHELLTSDDETIRMILDETIFLMFPSFNPDGAIMVTEWFYKYKDTEFNNTSLPYLYHVYCGHDNNRDSYQLTQDESRLFAQVVYREWVPQSFVDHHHMGSSGARFYIPPYLDPIHPNVDPLVWREHQLYGSHMAVALEQAGKSGFETGAPYTGWWQASFHMSTNYHNIAGMLTESASASWANPIYILPDQLRGTRGRPEYKPQMTMPRLWPGGWWRLRDIVEQQIISSKAVLELGARYRETLLRNMVRKAQGNIDRGEDGAPYAYIIPRDQHDFPTAVKLVRTFQWNGVEVHELNEPYQVGSRVFNPGSYVISCAQPMRVFVKSFLEQVNYPDNTWTRSHGDQSPIRPYDLAGYSVSEQMGVEAIPIGEPLRGIEMSVLENEVRVPAGTVTTFNVGRSYMLSHNSNEAFRAINRLFKEGFDDIYWAKEGFGLAHERANRNEVTEHFFPVGSIFIEGDQRLKDYLEQLADELGLDFLEAPRGPFDFYKLKPVRLGLYQRYAGGNMDEGWTNWMLQDFEFDFETLHNSDIKDSRFPDLYDVIIIPSDGTSRIVNGSTGSGTPPEYRGGIGQDGVENIRQFVENGGTLITLNGAWEFAQSTFNLPVSNTLDGVTNSDFYCPGSTLNISVNTDHPLGYGIPQNALALFRSSPALQVSSGNFADGVSVPVRYHEENILQSGWLIGEQYLSEKPAALEFKIGLGKVIVLAFPAQHRAQTHGTFKFLFNAIYYGPAADTGGNR
ncbi:M14 family zinc carboxypeptidase [candidate division KSB1 bacterium]